MYCNNIKQCCLVQAHPELSFLYKTDTLLDVLRCTSDVLEVRSYQAWLHWVVGKQKLDTDWLVNKPSYEYFTKKSITNLFKIHCLLRSMWVSSCFSGTSHILTNIGLNKYVNMWHPNCTPTSHDRLWIHYYPDLYEEVTADEWINNNSVFY